MKKTIYIAQLIGLAVLVLGFSYFVTHIQMSRAAAGFKVFVLVGYSVCLAVARAAKRQLDEEYNNSL